MKFYKKMIVIKDEYNRVKAVISPVMGTIFVPNINGEIIIESDVDVEKTNGIYVVNEEGLSQLNYYNGSVCEVIPVKNSKVILHQRGARLEKGKIIKIDFERFFTVAYNSIEEGIEDATGFDIINCQIKDFFKFANYVAITNFEDIRISSGEVISFSNVTSLKIAELINLIRTYPNRRIKNKSLILDNGFCGVIYYDILNFINLDISDIEAIANLTSKNKKISINDCGHEIYIRKFDFSISGGKYVFVTPREQNYLLGNYKEIKNNLLKEFDDVAVTWDDIYKNLMIYLEELTGLKPKRISFSWYNDKEKISHVEITDAEVVDIKKFRIFRKQFRVATFSAYFEFETALIDSLYVLRSNPDLEVKPLNSKIDLRDVDKELVQKFWHLGVKDESL